jgi:hypothetical protein
MSRFIRVHNKLVNVDSIAYVDFLDSGRAMIFMRGLTQEKQNIAVDTEEARKLKSLMDDLSAPGDSMSDSYSPHASPSQTTYLSRPLR